MSESIIRRVVRSEIKSVNPKDFTVEVTMSDETIDRYREVIKADAWKKRLGSYKEHPILLSSHNYHGLMNQIGESVSIGVKEDALRAKFKYYVGEEIRNPEAEWAWVLASKGIAAYSVGFIRHGGYYIDKEAEDVPKGVDEEEYAMYKKQGVRYVYTDVELLECSHVTVPANPACLQDSYEQGVVMRDLEEKAYPMLAELEAALQIIHPELKSESDESEKERNQVPIESLEVKKWEETENEIRHRLREPELFDKFRYITLKSDKPRVRAVLGKLKNEDNEWKLQALRFPKADGWTLSEAKKWVKDHPDVSKSCENEEEIIMGIDDLEEMVDSLKVKFSDSLDAQVKICLETMTLALKTASEEIIAKAVTAFDEELTKRKAQEVEEVVGKEAEMLTDTQDMDGVLKVFTEITEEMKKTFGVQS